MQFTKIVLGPSQIMQNSIEAGMVYKPKEPDLVNSNL